MALSFKKIIFKTLKIGSIILGCILLIMILVPYLFPNTVTQKIKGWANSNINGNISFTGTNLSFFKKFPSLTLTLQNVTLKGSAPFENDTLIAAKELSLGIDLSSMFKSRLNIDKISLSNAFINIQVDTLGHANYNIYKSAQQKTSAPADTSSASLGIRQILVENSRLVYYDRSLPMQIVARGFNYSGSGDLSQDVFDLYTHTDIQSLDFSYNNQQYIISKKINADLVTSINTKSLAFIFSKNDLNINQLPVQFNGRFAFIKDGYDMDFQIDSHEKDLGDIISALPAAYQKPLDQTEMDGTANIHIALTGQYIAKDSTMPDLSMSVKIRNGYIDNQKSPYPVSNLYMNMEATLPGLDPDSLYVNMDTLYFNVGKGYFSSVLRIKGVNEPDIYAKVNTEIDLEKWNKALGVKPVDIKGLYSLSLLAEGRYAKGVVYTGLRKHADTVITSIPKFTLRSSFREGYFKYASLPEAVKDIRFNLRADCPDNNVKHINVALDSLNATALGNYIKGYFRLGNTTNFPVDARLQAKFYMADLKQFYPADSIDIKGDLDADIQAKGNYLPAQKKYPVTTANINLKDGSILTKYYPHPISKIQVSTSIANHTGTLKGMNISIKPISFEFEGKPFIIKAELHDFTNLKYAISSIGTIDVGKIYQVFAQKGYNVNGTIAANLSLKGKQSDITAKRYDKLQNSGTLKVNNIVLTSDLFPKPFTISKGVFSFNQDKMHFDSFTATYGNSTIVLNGALSNVLDYALHPGATLKGEFTMKSDLLVVDDFMVYSGNKPTTATTKTSSTPSGVVMVPKCLDLTFDADVKKVKYSGLVIKDAKGHMTLSKDSIILKETGFSLIGAPITMNATYTSISPLSAFFDYRISAKDFDINKAYKKIKLFHDMVTSAKNTEGLISLDYHLSGKLNSNMYPVYPSLVGGGVLSAKALKMHQFKLFNAVGKTTGRDSVGGNPDVSKVEIKTTIAHNIITIERTKMRMAGFRAKIQGQVSLDQAIDLKFRLGLPPLGLIGIPMTITGTEDKPIVKLGKGKQEDELKEVEDD
ncbi:MAG: AsmA-like C-terminal region-containing protein [Flavipsychrobacter sp.]|nr:AsmA-like C-terminal region-containing protein [Flavipsychrobacter sp.]